MYLLNRQQLERHVSDLNSRYLTIKNFSSKNLQHTSYYFRVGHIYQIVHSAENKELKELTRENRILTIEPGQYVLIRTAEIFTLSEKVKAFVGSNGDAVSDGLLVNYSPFIDPLYDGWLEIGVKNLLDTKIHLKMGQKIGKLSFFDISDTYPIDIKKGSFQDSKFEVRSMYDESADDGVIYPEEEDDSEIYKEKDWAKKK